MTNKEFIEKYLHEATMDICGEPTKVLLSNETNCYVTHASLPNDISFIAEKEITKLYSTFGGKYPVANYGWSERDNKWYGWSHRAIFGFTIGSEVKFGDIGYVPKDREDWIKNELCFWDDIERENIHVAHQNEDEILLEWTYADTIPNKSMRGKVGSMHYNVPKSFGRGAWKAKTLDDARQMAMDFANNIA